MTGEFPAQRASNAENVSIWWRHRVENNTRVPTRYYEPINDGKTMILTHRRVSPSLFAFADDVTINYTMLYATRQLWREPVNNNILFFIYLLYSWWYNGWSCKHYMVVLQLMICLAQDLYLSRDWVFLARDTVFFLTTGSCAPEPTTRGFLCVRTRDTHNLFLEWGPPPPLPPLKSGPTGFSTHQPHMCLLNRLFRRRSKK